MKRLLFFVTIAVAGLMVSCDQNAEEPENLIELDYDEEAAVESAFEDLDLITDAGMESVDLSSGGRLARIRLLDCADVTHDKENKTITIDYGDGCEGPRGRVRSGKVIVQYSGRRFEPGSYRIVTTENFFLDGAQIEGERTLTNISESTTENPTFRVTLVGGKVTFEDSTFATREADRVRTWYRAENPLNDSTTVDGEVSGVNREGLQYSAVITETLLFKRECQRVFVPVAGVKVYTVDGVETIMDYGDGTCDSLATVSRDGESKEIELNPRRRRR